MTFLLNEVVTPNSSISQVEFLKIDMVENNNNNKSLFTELHLS